MQLLSSAGSVALIIFGFGVLIFVHELGHFLAAKWAGIRAEAFAVGMGPVALAWRQGVGLAFGSTDRKTIARVGRRADELTDEELKRHGIGETEYSLRWLPLGGFVKMLGQEDANPNAVSEDPRSYTRCPVGKRMIVVSAGVIMNVILALLLFVVAFLVGVRFEAPVVGYASPLRPAGQTWPENAEALGVTEPGLKAGDEIVSIAGRPAATFADIRIAAAMAKPEETIDVVVDRAGFDAPLRFHVAPEVGSQGLLEMGVEPAQSTRLLPSAKGPEFEHYLEQSGLAGHGIEAGMRIETAAGEPVMTWEGLIPIADASGGEPIPAVWRDEDGRTLTAPIPVRAEYQRFQVPGAFPDDGLLGLVPRTRIGRVLPGSANEGRLLPGDIVLAMAGVEFPRSSQFRLLAGEHAGGEVPLVVERDGARVEVDAVVSRKGRLNIEIGPDEDHAVIAQPLVEAVVAGATDPVRTATADANLPAGTAIVAVDGTPTPDWPALRAALREHTADARASGAGDVVVFAVVYPWSAAEAGGTTDEAEISLAPADVEALHDLGWLVDVRPELFEPVYTVLSADGNPLRAVTMGFAETHKMIVLTYLTIDRLFRGSIGVDQLHGPVGIIHLGSKILPRGLMYFIFFMGMISVNLAVLNFLPIPIVDGGLFLFLVYEKLKGKPPSIRFQNAATVAGLFLIGTVFLVTFYNDIMRLL